MGRLRAGRRLSHLRADGTHEIPVHSTVAPACSFREGIGAVVEGELRADDVFEASQVIAKHDENCVAPSEGGLPTQVFHPDS